jgi:16S rRNA processing protein RimM
MSEERALLDIGTIGRPHGLQGEVVVKLSTNVDDRLHVGATFVTDLRVLDVRSVRPHQGHQLVTFDGIADRAAAESIRGLVLRAEPLDEPPAEGYWVHDLIGSRVAELDGLERGVVEAIEANPASDLLVLDSGALVPVQFVVRVGAGLVEIDPPEGLFDL